MKSNKALLWALSILLLCPSHAPASDEISKLSSIKQQYSSFMSKIHTFKDDYLSVSKAEEKYNRCMNIYLADQQKKIDGLEQKLREKELGEQELKQTQEMLNQAYKEHDRIWHDKCKEAKTKLDRAQNILTAAQAVATAATFALIYYVWKKKYPKKASYDQLKAIVPKDLSTDDLVMGKQFFDLGKVYVQHKASYTAIAKDDFQKNKFEEYFRKQKLKITSSQLHYFASQFFDKAVDDLTRSEIKWFQKEFGIPENTIVEKTKYDIQRKLGGEEKTNTDLGQIKEKWLKQIEKKKNMQK